MRSKLLRFQEVDLAEVPDEVIPKTLEEAGLPESLCQFKLKNASVDVKSIVSSSSATKWQTFSGLTQWDLSSDQCTMSYLFKHSLMKHGQDCWKAFLFVPGLLGVLDAGIYFTAVQWCSVVLFVKAVPCPVDAATGSPLWTFAPCNTAASLLVKPVPDFVTVKLLPREWLSHSLSVFRHVACQAHGRRLECAGSQAPWCHS